MIFLGFRRFLVELKFNSVNSFHSNSNLGLRRSGSFVRFREIVLENNDWWGLSSGLLTFNALICIVRSKFHTLILGSNGLNTFSVALTFGITVVFSPSTMGVGGVGVIAVPEIAYFVSFQNASSYKSVYLERRSACFGLAAGNVGKFYPGCLGVE